MSFGDEPLPPGFVKAATVPPLGLTVLLWIWAARAYVRPWEQAAWVGFFGGLGLVVVTGSWWFSPALFRRDGWGVRLGAAMTAYLLIGVLFFLANDLSFAEKDWLAILAWPYLAAGLAGCAANPPCGD